MEAFFKEHKRILKSILTIAAVYFSFKYLLPLFVPFLAAYFFAWMLRPFAAWLNRRLRLPIYIGGGIGILSVLAAVGLFVFYVGRMLIQQLLLFLKSMSAVLSNLETYIGGFCSGCDRLFGLAQGTVLGHITSGIERFSGRIDTELLPALTGRTLRILGALALFAGMVLIIAVASLLWMKDMQEYKAGLRKSVYYKEVHKITKKLSETGIAYIKTQGIVISMVAVLNILALFIMRNPYALLIGIAVALFDSFPVLGSGMILVPWSIVSFFGRNFFNGAVLITLYLLCQVVREIIEPKLLGNKIGISPIVSLMSMYVGLQLFGVLGFFLGPLAVVIFRTVVYDEKDIQNLIPKKEELT